MSFYPQRKYKFDIEDKIYLNRPRSDYILLLKRAVLMLCAKSSDDVRDELGITPFTYAELMKFIRLNIECNVNLILNESEKK